MIKFYDLYKQDKIYHSTILRKFNYIFKKTNYILGNEVELFEKKFSKYVGSKYAIGCANGTDALTLALKCLKLPENSEVIIPAMTYCSTAFAVINSGLKPVLADILHNSSSIDVKEIKKKINKNTKVIMPVHLYGSPVNLDEIKKLIKDSKQKIYLIDDCSQAHGAIDSSNNKKKIGSSTDISCFSLYPGKNLGAYGDAGIITTNNKKYYSILNQIRNLGSKKKFIHEFVGHNSRLDTIQAAILSIKLDNLDKLNKKRVLIAKTYDNKIKNEHVQKIKYANNSVYHQYVILLKNRSKFSKYLDKNKIQYGFHYPYSIDQLKVFKNDFKNFNFKNANLLAKKGLSLPIDPNLTKKQINYIVKTINSFK